jgi:large subunit ribosomal protein L10
MRFYANLTSRLWYEGFFICYFAESPQYEQTLAPSTILEVNIVPSEKILSEKQKLVSALATKLKNASSGVLIDYKGITVDKDTKLRSEFRKANVEYTVIKNSILNLAAKEAGITGLDAVLFGTTSLAISTSDLIAPAKVITSFPKTADLLKIKAGFVEGKFIDATQVEALAKLPSKEVLISQVLAGFNAPITSFANVLNANLRGLVVALNAIAEQKASA